MLSQRVKGRLQSCTVLFTVDRHLDKLLAKWDPFIGTIESLLKKMICSFIGTFGLNLFFCPLEFSLENYLFEYDSDSSWIDSEKKFYSITLVPGDPKSPDVFINSSYMLNCFQNLLS